MKLQCIEVLFWQLAPSYYFYNCVALNCIVFTTLPSYNSTRWRHWLFLCYHSWLWHTHNAIVLILLRLVREGWSFIFCLVVTLESNQNLPHSTIGVLHYEFLLIGTQTVEEDTCYESPSLYGLSATVTGEYVANVMIWNANAPCPNSNQVFIHFAGEYDGTLGAPMFHGTYHAAVFDILPLPQGVAGCRRVDFHPGQHYCLTTWSVAQYGTNCPSTSTPTLWV